MYWSLLAVVVTAALLVVFGVCLCGSRPSTAEWVGIAGAAAAAAGLAGVFIAALTAVS